MEVSKFLLSARGINAKHAALASVNGYKVAVQISNIQVRIK